MHDVVVKIIWPTSARAPSPRSPAQRFPAAAKAVAPEKGTGRARQGSTRAPQWTHGGIVFAPKPRDYRYTVNKKSQKTGSEVRSVL